MSQAAAVFPVEVLKFEMAPDAVLNDPASFLEGIYIGFHDFEFFRRKL
jgi:hypothetical protein